MKNNVLISVNDGYVQVAEIFLYSLFCNNNAESYRIYIFESSLSKDNISLLKECINKYGAEASVCHVDGRMFSMAPKRNNISIETYYRLLAFELLDDVDKILYMDVDIIINDSISELFELDMSNYCIAGVPDQGWVQKDYYHKARIGVNIRNEYINGGVILMNLERMREQYKFKDIISYIDNMGLRLKYQDQDVVNALFKNEIMILPRKYNYAPIYNGVEDFFKYIMGTWRRKPVPVIIHYMGEECKPWREEGYGYKYLGVYYKYCKFRGDNSLNDHVKNNMALKKRVCALLRQYNNLCVSGEDCR